MKIQKGEEDEEIETEPKPTEFSTPLKKGRNRRNL